MIVRDAEALTKRIATLQPLRTTAQGPELYFALNALHQEVSRAMQGPWSIDELERYDAYRIINTSTPRVIEPELIQADKAVTEAREAFERSDKLWQQAGLALLKSESRPFGSYVTSQPSEKKAARIRLAGIEKDAALLFRNEELEKLTEATIARNKLAFELQDKRVAKEYWEGQEQQQKDKESRAEAKRQKAAESLDRLKLAASS